MKAIILAGGRGERLMPLTLNTPKPLLKVGNQTLLERAIRALPDRVDNLVIVIGYLGEQIKNFCGSEFLGKKVDYVWQGERLGTGHALEICEHLIKDNEKFFMLYADDLLDKRALNKCLDHNLCVVVKEHENPSRFGVVSLRKDGTIAEILEKPENPPTNLVNVGPMILTKKVLQYKVAPDPKNGEYYLTRMVSQMASDFPIYPVKADFWIPIATVDDLENAKTNDY